MIRVVSIKKLIEILNQELGEDDLFVKVYTRALLEEDTALKESLVEDSMNLLSSYEDLKRDKINNILIEWLFGKEGEGNEFSGLEYLKPANDLPC